MPNQKAAFEEAPVVRLETAEQAAQARAQIAALEGAEAGSVDELLRASLEFAIQTYESQIEVPPAD